MSKLPLLHLVLYKTGEKWEVNSNRYPVGKYGHNDNGINNNKQSSAIKIYEKFQVRSWMLHQ